MDFFRLRFLISFLLFVPSVFLSHVAFAEGRVALIIGNNDYPADSRFPDLDNPVRDAGLMAGVLRDAGFTVIQVRDASRTEMVDALARFHEAIEAGGDAVFYFAGHGIEHERKNYLMGSNARFQNKFLLGEESLEVHTVLQAMAEKKPRSAVLFLDCCREYPDDTWLVSGRGYRGRGIGSVQHPDIMIAFAAAPGGVAADGGDDLGLANSPYTTALAAAIRSGAEITDVFKTVRREVHRLTGGGQRTWETGSFLHDFFFIRGAHVAMAKAPKEAGGYSYDAGELRAGTTRSFAGIEFVWCPPGEFMMGSPGSEADRGADETQHRVRLTQGYWLAKTECTQAQWERVMGSNPSDFKGETLPVESVSFEDVQGFLDKLNQRSGAELPAGMRFALPTEAQWEYACRAGTTGAYAGDLRAMGWYSDNAGGQPHPVGGKGTNAWGLHDMHGNVWEWCQDWMADYPPGTLTDPQGPATGSNRVVRGGGWNYYARNCRSANRNHYVQSYTGRDLGFRSAVVPSP